MKKTTLIALALLGSMKLFCQCPSNGITTDPSAPVNNQLPSKKNLYFDWRQPSWQSNTSCQPLTQIESPFFKTDNLEILRQSKDMQPEDGWELIRREFGYDDNNNIKPDVPEHSYFILYNKFTGVLRVLLKTCRVSDYSGAKITLKFDATTNYQTSLLDFTSTLKANDEPFTKNPAAQSTTVFVNDKTKWFYADFPTAYDPCTCNYQSKINIISQLIQNSSITLDGSITGTITSITNGSGTVNNSGSYSFKDFVNDADKFKKGYSSVDAFISETKNVAQTFEGPNSDLLKGLTNLQAALKDNQFLKTGLAAVPWLKAASGLLDFFSGGGKTQPQLVQLMPLAVNLSLKVTGTITTSNQYHDIKFSTPGSLNAQNDPAIYPFYNEILGVFNLMNGPKFQYSIYQSLPPYAYTFAYTFNLKSPVKWVLNPASNLQLQDAQAAYVFLSKYNSASPSPTIAAGRLGSLQLEGKDAVSGNWEYRTDYKDINALAGDDNLIYFMVQNGGVDILTAPGPKAYLKLILNFKRTDNPSAQNVLLVLKYPIPLDGPYTVRSGGGFSNPYTGNAILQASATDINSFCSSSSYTNNRQNSSRTPVVMTRDSVNRLDLGDSVSRYVSIFPNPVSGILHIKGNMDKTHLTGIQIIGVSGGIVYSERTDLSGAVNHDINCDKLPAGTYMVKLQYADNTHEVHKLMVLQH